MYCPIYAHCSEGSKNLEGNFQSYPGLEIFEKIEDIELVIQSSKKNIICCVTDISIVEILSIRNNIWIINESVLSIILKDLKNNYYEKRLLYGLLSEVVIKFFGFPKDDELMALGTKAIIMGAKLTKDNNMLTHLIPYRMCGSEMLDIRRRKKNVKIFDKIFIEYYWTNCLTILTPYKCITNAYIQEIFKAKLFMNCSIILLGFNENKMKSIIKLIVNNGGSVINMNSMNEASHIIYNSDCDIPEIYLKEFVSNSLTLQKNIVNDKWFQLSITNDCLSSSKNYRWFNSTIDNNLEDTVSHDDDINNNEEVFESNNTVGYDPSKVSSSKVRDHELQLLKAIGAFVSFFTDKEKFFQDFISFLSPLIVKYTDLQMVSDYYMEILKFYSSLNTILIPLINNYDTETFIGMIVCDVYSRVGEYHKKFSMNFVKIESQLKRVIKKNVEFKEQFETYLNTTTFKIDGLINRPMLLLTFIRVLINDILTHLPYLHPDIRYLQQMIDKTDDILRYHSSLVSMNMENNKQALISKCTNMAICSSVSKFVSIVDCVLEEDDGLSTPMSMFLFTDKILLSKFINQSDIHKKCNKIYRSLSVKKDANVSMLEEVDETLSRHSSVQSLFTSPFESGHNKTICSRKESIRSHSSSMDKSPFNVKDAINFSKVFGGLAELSLWEKNVPILYTSNTVYHQSRISAVITYVNGNSIVDQLSLTLELAATDTQCAKQLKLVLVPRLLKNLSDYGKIKTVFNDDLPWELKVDSYWSLEHFLVDQKSKFCEFVAKLYDVSCIELGSRSFSIQDNFSIRKYGSQMSVLSSDSVNFATPKSSGKSDQKDGVFKKCFKKVRQSLLRSPSTNNDIKTARNYKEKHLLSGSDDKENDGFLTPQCQRSVKRKSRDHVSSDVKNAKF